MKISAVIPAYNEAKTIGEVVEILKDHSLVMETIVVNDGSTDKTAQIADKPGIKVINLAVNQGKGAAMQQGINFCQGDIILFLDADLLGLKNKHINQLLEPVLNNSAKMTVGVFTSGRVVTDLAHKITPFLSGQRAMKKELLDEIEDLNSTDYGVELAITNYVQQQEVKIEKVELKDVSHRMKEEKLGVRKGLIARLKMYWDLIKNLPNRFKIK